MQFDIKKKKNFNYKIVNAILFDQLMKVLKRKFEFRNERCIQEVIIRWWWSPNIRYILKARFPYRFDDRGTYMSANKTNILNEKKMFYFFCFLNWIDLLIMHLLNHTARIAYFSRRKMMHVLFGIKTWSFQDICTLR